MQKKLSMLLSVLLLVKKRRMTFLFGRADSLPRSGRGP